MLGIYRGSAFMILETLEGLRNAQLHLPVVVTLQNSSYSDIDMISIFPAFYSIDRHPTIHQVLAEYFDNLKDQSYYILADAGKVFSLSIYLVDACDLKFLQRTFPKIDELTFLNLKSCVSSSC